MSKKALRKDFRMEVKKSMNRFVSILFIVAMGVSMFAGIHSAAPDMRYTSDEFYDATNLMDIRVVGTMGITDGDIEALAALSGVQSVEPGYMTDVLCPEKDKQTVLHIESMLQTMNQLSLTEGRLPENSGECFLDQEYLLAYGYQVGDSIEVFLPDEEEETETEPEGEDEDMPLLRTTRFQIVGSGYSSSYISYNRGSSSVGSGEVAGFMFILPEDFDSDVYMAAYLVVEGAAETVAYTAEYEQMIEKVLEDTEGIQDVRCEMRYHEVVEEVQATLDKHMADLREGESELSDAKKELEEGKAEAESELAKAKEDLESGESELEEGKLELKEKEVELADAKIKMADGEAEIAEQEAKLADAKAQLADGESQLASAERTLRQKQSEYNTASKKAKEELDTGQKELDAAKVELEAGKAQLESESQKLDAAEQQSSEAELTLAAAQAEYDASAPQALAELEAGQAVLDAEKAKLETGKAQLESENQKLESAAAQSNAAKELLTAKQAEYDAGAAALAGAEQTYAQNKAALDSGLAAYDTAAAALETEKQACEAEQAALTELENQKAEALSEVGANQQTAADLRTANTSLQAEIQTLNAEIQSLSATISSLENEISGLETTLTDLNSQLKIEEDKLAAEKENPQGKEEEIAGKINNLKTQIGEVNGSLGEKQASKESAQSSLGAKNVSVTEKQAKIGENEAAIGAAEAAAVEAQAKADGLTVTITEKTASLTTMKADLDRKVTDLAAEKATLDGISAQLSTAKAELDLQSAALTAGKAELDAGWAKWTAGNDQISAGQAALAENKAKLEAGAQELEANQTKINEGREKLAAGKAELDAGWAELETGKSQIAAGREKLAAGKAELEAGEKEIEANQNKINEGRAELASGKTQLESAWAEINGNKSTLESSKAQIKDGETKLAEGKQTLADSKAEILEGEQKIADAWVEIAENEQKMKDGWIEYEEGKAEAESEILDGEEKIREAETELADARVKLADAQKEIDDLEVPEWYVNDRTVNPEYSGYGDNAERIRNIGKVFPVLFFLVAALISLTTMTRMVEEQRTQIGTLKALGYSKFSIASKYMKYALYATLGGSVAGVLFGEKLFPYIIVWAYGMMYPNLRSPVIPYNWEYGLMATGAALVCTLGATFSACYKELAATPAVLMRPPAPKEGKRVLLEYLPFIWKRMNFTWKSTIRNLFRYKKRFFMTVIGIGGCMGLLLLGFGLKDSIVGIGDMQYDELQTYDMMAILDPDSSVGAREELTAYLNEELGEKGQKDVLVQMISVTDGKKEYMPYLYVPENLDNLEEFLIFRDRISHETYQLSDDGAIVTEKLAAMLGIKEGEELVISDDEKGMLSVPIAHIAENYLSHYVYLTPKLYEHIYGETVEYNGLLLNCRRSKDRQMTAETKKQTETRMQRIGEQILDMEGALNVTYSGSVADQLADQLASMDLIIWVLIICAGMLAFVVLYNLNNININERKRELATLKVLGFHNSEVAAYVYRENILLTAIGVALGLGMGGVLHRFIITTVEVDNCMFGRRIAPISYVYGTLFTFAFSAIVNGVMYFKLKKIDMVESLKSVE